MMNNKWEMIWMIWLPIYTVYMFFVVKRERRDIKNEMNPDAKKKRERALKLQIIGLSLLTVGFICAVIACILDCR